MLVDKIEKFLIKQDKEKPLVAHKVFTTMFTKACQRQSAYKFHAFVPKEKQARMFINFEIGYAVEKVILENAKKAGCEIEFNNAWLGVIKDGTNVVCKPDGLYKDKKGVLYNVEIKKMSEYGFKSFKENGLNNDWGYISQANFECEAWKQQDMNVVGTIFIVVNGNTGHLAEEFIKFDSKVVEKMLARVRTVMNSTKNELPERYYKPELKSGKEYLPVECSYCDYTQHCWPNFKLMFSKGGSPLYVKEN